jgi:hypothetical protein
MNARVLVTIVFALLPSLALAQSSDQTKSKANEAGQERQWLGREWRGDAGWGRIRRERDHRAVVEAPISSAVNKDREPLINTSEQHRSIDPEWR